MQIRINKVNQIPADLVIFNMNLKAGLDFARLASIKKRI